MLITPSAFSGPLWVVASVQDNAGNGTGLLLFSALVALGWVRDGRGLLAPLMLGGLSVVAGFGFIG